MSEFKKILVPTDFSENSIQVFEVVGPIAKRNNALVDLIHVMPRQNYAEIIRDMPGYHIGGTDQNIQLGHHLKGQLRQIMVDHIADENRGDVYVDLEGDPAGSISSFAKKNDYDLIFIASRGLNHTIFTRGSVTEKLIRISETPVISVGGKYNPELENILVTTDGSHMSLEVLPYAFNIATKNSATIELLSVSEFKGAAIRIADKISEDDIAKDVLYGLRSFAKEHPQDFTLVEEEVDGVKKYSLKSELGIAPLRIIGKKAISMSAHSVIIEHALRNTDLVAMATHGRGGLARLVMGSTTTKVMHQLDLPILTIRPGAGHRKQ